MTKYEKKGKEKKFYWYYQNLSQRRSYTVCPKSPVLYSKFNIRNWQDFLDTQYTCLAVFTISKLWNKC